MRYLLVLLLLDYGCCNQCSDQPRVVLADKRSGIIESNPRSTEYLKDKDCEWFIKAPNGSRFIKLVFDEFETECMYDYVTVYDHNDESGLKLAAINGHHGDGARTVISTTGYMYIHKVSDFTETFGGFRASFTVFQCPNNCTQHGRCMSATNTCNCYDGWYGEQCDQEALDCSDHGELDAELNKCSCNDGYFGWQCDLKDVAKLRAISQERGRGRNINKPFNKWYTLVKSQSRHSIVNWDQTKEMLPRQGHTADVIGDYLYIFGGYDLNDVLYSFKRLHILTGTWEDVSIGPDCRLLPKGRYMHRSVVFQDNIFYCGGYIESNTELTKECWIFNTTLSCWIRQDSLAEAVVGHTLTLVDSHTVYLFGGVTEHNTEIYSCSLYKRSLAGNESGDWVLVTPRIHRCSQIRRSGHTTVYDAVSRSLVVYGGFVPRPKANYAKSNDILLYSITSQIWSVLKFKDNIPGLVFHSAVQLGRFMVVYGGSAANSNPNHETECFSPELYLFDLECMDWITALSPGKKFNLATARHSHAAAVYQSSMLVVGGFSGQPMNDVLVYYPPTEDCSRISWTDCKSMVHCVRCRKGCKKVSECRSQTDRCSVCYKLRYCTECVLAGCEWCVEEESCRARDRRNMCGVQSPQPWWGRRGTLITTPHQCQTEDMPPGLHWIKYVDPINRDHPENVSIVRMADVSLKYDKETQEITEGEVQYYGHLRGFISANYRNISGTDYELRYIYKDGVLCVLLGRDAQHSLAVNHADCAVNASRSIRVKKTEKCRLPYYEDDEVYIEFVLSQYLIHKQRRSNLTIKWNGGGIDFRTEDKLQQDTLKPYRNGNCSSYGTCLSCLTDQYCGWYSGLPTPRCQHRSVPLSVADQYLITDVGGMHRVGKCIVCEDHLSCSTCVQDPVCEWTGLKCYRKGRYRTIRGKQTTVDNVNNCPRACSVRNTCYSCTEDPNCAWCKTVQRCVSVNVKVLLYPFGLCAEYHYISGSTGNAFQCSSCEMYSNETCRDCLSVQGCGWCGVVGALHTGRCIQGNYEMGDCEDPALPGQLQWYYQECPALHECALGLHNCHEFADCIDTPSSYICKCKTGYRGDGVSSCESTCSEASKTCKHGACNHNNVCECNKGYTGINCDVDCGCNFHSTCSQGSGMCDKCEHMTEGPDCGSCGVGGYRANTSTADKPCDPCNCNMHHDYDKGYCDKVSGRCHCEDHTTGFNCELCEEGYYGNALNDGVCYMVARSRIQLQSVSDGALGNVQSVRHHRHTDTGYQNVLWYINPPLKSASIVLNIDSFKTSNPDLPGSLYIWEGLPAHIAGRANRSRLLVKLSAELITQLKTRVNVVATGEVSLLYEGMISTRFNVSYQLRNCTHNCHNPVNPVNPVIRFNKTCSYDMVCECAEGFMGPQCDTRICPNDCNNQGQCVASTGVCKCDSSSSGLSCETRSSAHITWTVKSFDWVPPGQPIMGPRMAHSAVVMTVNGREVLVIFGGYSLYSLYNDTWLFDTALQTWSQLNTTSPTPTARYFHSTVLLEDRMCVIGGITETSLSSEVWCLRPGAPATWTRLDTSGLAPVAGAGAVTYTPDSWYMYGGVTAQGPSNTLYMFDAGSGLWNIVPTKGYIEPMYGHTMSFYKNSLYVIGNKGYYKYSIDSSSWGHVLPIHDQKPAILRSQYHCVTAVADGVIFVTGGMVDQYGNRHTLNKDLHAIQLETGSHIQLTSEQYYTPSILASQILYSNNKLYIVGGFNASVHSNVLSYDLLDSICFLIKDEVSCSGFGCAWCDSQHSPKPCIPNSLPGCPRRGPRPHFTCRLYSDCATCTAHTACVWSTASRKCSAQEIGSVLLRNTCAGACAARSNCSTCHENAQCTWYKGSCADTVNVPKIERQCPPECSDISRCTACTVKQGCSWSKTLASCLPLSILDWSCLFDRCDLLVSPVQCPAPCSHHSSCSVCREHNECGWCQDAQQGSRGACVSGDFSAPLEGDCDSWHFFTCPLENECQLNVHTCRDDQLCIDLQTGYECTCPEGTVNSALLDECVPSCSKDGCVHGTCEAVDTCVCEFGYYGADCGQVCDCSGHSECRNGTCLECRNNTRGARCELCVETEDEPYVRSGTECLKCSAVCNYASNKCRLIGSDTQLRIDNVKCDDCQNNTKGTYCEECEAEGYFKSDATGLCRKCMCNGHAATCDNRTGLNCPCQNNTVSSISSHGQSFCLDPEECYKNQCDVCKKGYSGEPTDGAWCYRDLPIPEDPHQFEGRANMARTFNVEIAGTEEHWIYLEMRNTSGVVWVSQDPREYRTMNYYSNEPKLRSMQPWITGVTHITSQLPGQLPAPGELISMDCERRFIRFTPDPNPSRVVRLYMIMVTHNDGGTVSLTWYLSSSRNNYYLMLNVMLSGVVLLVVFYYITNSAVQSLLYLLRQRADSDPHVSNRPKFIVSVRVDVGSCLDSERVVGQRGSGPLAGYRPLPQRELLPEIRPLALQEVTPAGVRNKCGLGTFLVRLPGPLGRKNRLVLGSSLLRTHRKTLDLEAVPGKELDLIRETSL